MHHMAVYTQVHILQAIGLMSQCEVPLRSLSDVGIGDRVIYCEPYRSLIR
jgi:hypothetical protein